MKLSSSHNKTKLQVLALAKDVQNELAINKSKMTEEQIAAANDVIAIAKTIQSATDDTHIKNSAMRVAKLIRAAFSEDVADVEMRKEIKENQKALVKEIPIRGGEGKQHKDTPDNTQDDSGKTCSSMDPSLIAERILRDVRGRYYHSVQDAFDGYCADGGAYIYASAQQKCRVAKLLIFYGCKIEYSKFEKEAAKDKAAALKQYAEKTAVLDVYAADYDLVYCPNCKSTTKHSKQGDVLVCSCGSKKKPQGPSRAELKKKGQQDGLNYAADFLSLLKQKLFDKFKMSGQGSQIADADIKMSAGEVLNEHGDIDPVEAQQDLSDPGIMEHLREFVQQNIVQGAKEVKAYSYACGSGKCGYKEARDAHGEYGCPKCGGKLVFSKEDTTALKTAGAACVVRKTGKTWSLFRGDELVEGGFFSKDAADASCAEHNKTSASVLDKYTKAREGSECPKCGGRISEEGEHSCDDSDTPYDEDDEAEHELDSGQRDERKRGA